MMICLQSQFTLVYEFKIVADTIKLRQVCKNYFVKSNISNLYECR